MAYNRNLMPLLSQFVDGACTETVMPNVLLTLSKTTEFGTLNPKPLDPKPWIVH